MISTVRESTAPPEPLWATLADVASWPDLLANYTSIRQAGGPVPTDVGSRFDVRQPGLRPATYEVTVWEPESNFTWVARNPGVLVTASHSITALEGGNRLTLGIEMSGPLAWLVRPLLARKIQRLIEAEADGLTESAQSHG